MSEPEWVTGFHGSTDLGFLDFVKDPDETLMYLTEDVSAGLAKTAAQHVETVTLNTWDGHVILKQSLYVVNDISAMLRDYHELQCYRSWADRNRNE